MILYYENMILFCFNNYLRMGWNVMVVSFMIFHIYPVNNTIIVLKANNCIFQKKKANNCCLQKGFDLIT